MVGHLVDIGLVFAYLRRRASDICPFSFPARFACALVEVACLVELWLMSSVSFAPLLVHVFGVRLRAMTSGWLACRCHSHHVGLRFS